VRGRGTFGYKRSITARQFGPFGSKWTLKYLLVTTSPWASGVKTNMAAIEVGTGKVVWHTEAADEFSGFFTEPLGAGFAIMFKSIYDQAPHPTVYIVMVFTGGASHGPPGTFLRP